MEVDVYDILNDQDMIIDGYTSYLENFIVIWKQFIMLIAPCNTFPKKKTCKIQELSQNNP